MDLKAKYLLETCSDPIEFLNQLRQTTEPIGGGTEYREDGELVEYDVAIEAIKKATDAFIEKAEKYLESQFINDVSVLAGGAVNINFSAAIKNFVKYMKGEEV